MKATYLKLQYIKKNKTLLEISKQLNTTPQSVLYWMKKFKIKRRKSGRKKLPFKKCIDCGKILKERRAIRCKSCSKRKELHGYWKGGLPHCVDCDKELTDYRSIRCSSCAMKLVWSNNKLRKKLSKVLKGQHNSIETEFKSGKNHPMFGKKGKLSPSYVNGEGNKPYPLEFDNQLKESIRKRDNYQCQLCGIKEKDYYRKLDNHHIDYNKDNLDKSNLITLCNQCNCKVNYNRDYWYAYFIYLMENKLK